jgi:membrane dipeptidase
MMVDVSHVADATFWGVLEVSSAPAFASHSSCRALSNIPRNMTDEMIAAMAKKGGVIQINFGCEFLSQRSADSSAWGNPALRRKLEAEAGQAEADPARRQAEIDRRIEAQGREVVRASIEDVVAHIDHVVKLAGIDAVGIGSDFDGVSCVPVGLGDNSKFPNLTRALLEKGYTAEQVRKIYGGNLLRVMRAAEAASRAAGGAR